jgi:hypothetical protein
MAKRFRLKAMISSDNINAVKPALKVHFPKANIKSEGHGLLIEAELEGDDVKELNRKLLSALRKAEKRTRLRSEWTSESSTTYYFFDYVLKRTSS